MKVVSYSFISLLSVHFVHTNASSLKDHRRDIGDRSLLPELLVVESSNDEPGLLQLCQGDCDLNSDCADNLICYNRNDRNAAVPGCTTGSLSIIEDDVTISFCIDPNTLATNTIDIPVFETNVESSSAIIALNGTIPVELIVPQNVLFPEGISRLQKCQGDCDEDAECSGVLMCFQRSSYEPVPGCSGYEEYRTVDFCYDPADDIAVEEEGDAVAEQDDIETVPDMICLYQSNFTHGTLILNVSGVYGLCEDVSFCPNAPTSEIVDDDAFDPIFPSEIYDEHAYALGFFAAIAITCSDITIHLNGYTIDQCEGHALMQRFFSIIELAAEPFISNAGPHMFVGPNDTFVCGNNVNILGPGVMGRSSHHSIHGNQNVNITIRDIVFTDFEVAAVALNKVTNLQILNCIVDGNRKDVPITGLFSAARFIRPHMKYLKEQGFSMMLRNEVVTASDLYDLLIEKINIVYNDIMNIGEIDAVAHPDEFRLFNNPHRVIDGPCYAFLIHGRGPAINGFGDWFPSNVTLTSSNILIRNNTIRDFKCYNREIPAAVINGTIQIDVRGSVFQFVDTVSHKGIALNTTDGTYAGDIVADAQIMVAKAIHTGVFNQTAGNPLLMTNVNKLSPALVTWAEGIPFGTPPVTPTLDPLYRCNGDSMHHVAKGINMIRIDDTEGFLVQNNTIEDIINLSSPGFENCNDFHLLTDLQNVNRHQLATIRGIVVSATRAFADGNLSIIEQNTISKFFSVNADYIVGIDVQGDTNGLCIINNTVDLSINAEQNTTDAYFGLLIGQFADSNGTATTIVVEGNLFSEEERRENTQASRRLRSNTFHHPNTVAGSLEWEVYRGRRVLTEEEMMQTGGCPFASSGRRQY